MTVLEDRDQRVINEGTERHAGERKKRWLPNNLFYNTLGLKKEEMMSDTTRM